MRILEFDNSVSLASVVSALKSVPEKEVTLRLSPDTPWLANPVNKKILRKAAQGFAKSIHFEGEDDPPATSPIPTPSTVGLHPPAQPESPDTAPAEDPPADYQEENEDPDDTGFVVGQDVASSPTPALAASVATEAPQFHPAAEPEITNRPISPTPSPYIPSRGLSGKIRQFGHFLLAHWIMSLIGALVIVLLLIGYVIFFLPKADLNIIVEQRPLESSATVTASTKATSADTKAHTIPALAKTSSQSGTLQATTSGSKLTGTKAQGTVTLYNNTDLSKSLAAGDKITASASSGSLKFTVAQATTLPKRNQLTGVPSGVDVSINASDIGDKYNLPQNTAFSLDQDPVDIKGTNAAAFSGGTSKTVQVVAQTDLDKLTADLTKTLTDKAKADVLSQVGKDYQVESQGVKTSTSSKSFDHAVGDQVDTVTLNLTISATATAYKTSDLKDMLVSSLEGNVPDGFQVDKSNVTSSADLTQVADNGDLVFAGHVKANLTPKYDTGKLAHDLASKKPSAAEPIIKSLPQLVSYHVSFWPNLPDPIKTFPTDPHRIHITVSVNK